MNEQQEVNISKAKVEIGSALLQAGVISKEEERQRLVADPLSGYDGLGDGLSSQLPEQEQAGPSGMPDGMQAMDAAQWDWREYLHPQNEKGQFTCKGQGVPLKGVQPKLVEKSEQTALQVSVGGGGKYGNTVSITQSASKPVIVPKQIGVTTAKQSIEKANVKKSTSVLPRESNYGVAVHAGESVREGVDPYQIYNTGSAKGSRISHEDLSAYTVNDLLVSTEKHKNTDLKRHFANGRYQMTPDLFKDAIKNKVITGNEKFTPQLQEYLFINYIAKTKRAAIYKYLTGSSDNLDAALMQHAMEFASAGVPYDFVREDPIFGKVNGKRKRVGTNYSKMTINHYI